MVGTEVVEHNIGEQNVIQRMLFWESHNARLLQNIVYARMPKAMHQIRNVRTND